MPDQKPDLTTPDAIAKSQEIYQRIQSGQTTDATRELHAAHGTTPKRD